MRKDGKPEKAYNFYRGDELDHPVFGRIKIEDITLKDGGYDLLCDLLDFNNTKKSFDALDLVRIRFKRKTRFKIVKD